MIKTIALVLSIVLNVCLAALLVQTGLRGCAEAAEGRVGVLSRDVAVGPFNSGKPLFQLPRGLIVRDASASGAGWFEPHRFRVVVTSTDAALVAYDGSVSPLAAQDSELYSADVAR